MAPSAPVRSLNEASLSPTSPASTHHQKPLPWAKKDAASFVAPPDAFRIFLFVFLLLEVSPGGTRQEPRCPPAQAAAALPPARQDRPDDRGVQPGQRQCSQLTAAGTAVP